MAELLQMPLLRRLARWSYVLRGSPDGPGTAETDRLPGRQEQVGRRAKVPILRVLGGEWAPALVSPDNEQDHQHIQYYESPTAKLSHPRRGAIYK